MNKEILRKNIEQVINQTCNAKYIMVKVTCDDSSWQCNLVDREGNPIDYVECILEHLPDKYRDHLVTLKYGEYDYKPVFDTDTQAVWDKELSDFYDAKQAWCNKYGCE